MARIKKTIPQSKKLARKKKESNFTAEMVVKFGQEMAKKNGLSSINIKEIADKMGCSISTIYKIFKNNEEIILHINSVTLDDMKKFITDNINPKAKNIEAIKDLAKFYIKFSRQNYNRWCALFEFRFSRTKQPPSWYEDKVTDLLNLVEKPLSKIFLDSKKVKSSAQIIWASIHGICILNLNKRLNLADDPLNDSLDDTLLYSLADSMIENYLQGIQK